MEKEDSRKVVIVQADYSLVTPWEMCPKGYIKNKVFKKSLEKYDISAENINFSTWMKVFYASLKDDFKSKFDSGMYNLIPDSELPDFKEDKLSDILQIFDKNDAPVKFNMGMQSYEECQKTMEIFLNNFLKKSSSNVLNWFEDLLDRVSLPHHTKLKKGENPVDT